MKIISEKDLKEVDAKMHDSEFNISDFGFSSGENKFVLCARAVTMEGKFFQTRAQIQHGKHFCLELFNVTKYNPINLEKIKAGKAIGGVFNYIKIRNHGKKLTIVSQDLCIELELSELAGKFEEIQPDLHSE